MSISRCARASCSSRSARSRLPERSGMSMTGAFFRVALPLARPALAGGLALVLMEALNDLGATEYLGVRTLTVSAYQTWLQRSSLAGAAEIAAITLFFVAAAFTLERASRGGGSLSRCDRALAAGARDRDVAVSKAGPCWRIVLVPVVLGFVLPMAMLTGSAWRYLGEVLEPGFWRAALNSVCSRRLRPDLPRRSRLVPRLRAARRPERLHQAGRAPDRLRLCAPWHHPGAGAAHPARCFRQLRSTACCDPGSASRPASSSREPSSRWCSPISSASWRSHCPRPSRASPGSRPISMRRRARWARRRRPLSGVCISRCCGRPSARRRSSSSSMS